MATESQKKARDKWNKKNKKSKIYNYKSRGKSFILNYASSKDLDEYESYIAQRREQLKKKIIYKKSCWLYTVTGIL